uniref:MSP domain-containing protein n=1 Tax=Ditylenchus dipsaci TaxID=166011 RepID=A0A915E367_9BILA
MTVDNLSKRNIAFAIKSNAIPRLYCLPPFGIIKPKEKQLVAVSVQKFDVEAVDVSRDRIAFDYVFCPADTQKFSHRLFGGSETRRRKNIFIKYNP